MKVTTEMVEGFITDGAASAIQAAKGDAGKIAARMHAELESNKSHTSTNTIKMSITISLDGDARKVEIEGGYGFTMPNLGNTAPKIVRDIPNPDQPELPGTTVKDAFDATTEEPETEE